MPLETLLAASQRNSPPEVKGIPRQEIKTTSRGLPDKQIKKSGFSSSEETSRVESTRA